MAERARPRPLPSRRRAFWRRVVITGLWGVLLILVVGLGAAGGVLAGFLRDLPPLDGLEEYQPSVATTLYTDLDEPFASFYEQRRSLVPLSKIPPQLKQAVLAVEDARFYEHHGLSVRGIVRAVLTNLQSRRRAQGGSTITQQLARQLFLTPEKSFARKIKEALLAVEIEKHYSKDKILEMYLNQVYFGHGAYGVEAAAQTYFRKSVDQISLAEAAMIAGLPSAPSRFSPIVDPARARRRRDHVLNRMADEKFITRAQAEAAGKTGFDEVLLSRSRTVAPYFVEHVRQQLEDKYGAYALYNSGLKVYTTLSLKMQRAAEDALVGGLRELDKAQGYRRLSAARAGRSRLGPYTPRPGEILAGTVLKVRPSSLEVQLGRYRGEVPPAGLKWTKLTGLAETFHEGDSVLVKVLAVNDRQRTVELALEQDPDLEGALVALEPRDGAVKAMVGGYDFERSKFNRATQAKRQPGSAFKPFVYATAFDRGLTPTTLMEDSPITFHFRAGSEVMEWSPDNFDRKFRGPITLRHALEHSINVVTVKLLQRVGVDPVVQLAHQLGINSELRKEMALALGVSEVTPLELTSAFGVLANGGVRAEPFTIRRVTDSQGRTLEEHVSESERVMRPETVSVLVNVMKGVVERGTATRARVLNRPVAGKTGTTSEATDVWFVGFTPNLAAGVWLGYDVKRSLGPDATGGRLALPVWIAFMQRILEDLPPDDFEIPEGVVRMSVSLESGLPASPGEKGVILEYFVKGTEPHPPGPSGGSPPPVGGFPTVPPPEAAPPETPPEPRLAPPSEATGGSSSTAQR